MASTSSSSPRPRYTLYTYAASPATHSSLPVLDPAGLYIASLLRTCSTSESSQDFAFQIKAPSVWLHKSLPRLEQASELSSSGSSGLDVVVGEGVQGCQAYILRERRRQRRHSRSAYKTETSSHEQEKQGGWVEEDEEVAASVLSALSAHIATHVEPLVISTFFPPTHTEKAQKLFDKVTFPAYANGLPFPSSRTVPHRLRDAVRGVLLRPGSSGAKIFRQTQAAAEGNRIGARESLSEQEKKRQRTRDQMRPVGGGSSGSRILRFGKAEKLGWSEEFARERLVKATREALRPVVSILSTVVSESSEGSSPLPAPLLHLWSLLAPLLLFDDADASRSTATSASSVGVAAMQDHPVVELLKTDASYADLRAWVKRVHSNIWGADAQRLKADGKPWYSQSLGATGLSDTTSDDQSSARRASSPLPSASRAPPASMRTRISSFLPWLFPSTGSSQSSATDAESLAAQRRRQTLVRGRAIWIASALLGTIGWAFLSGVIQIGYTDEDEEDEDEEGVTLEELANSNPNGGPAFQFSTRAEDEEQGQAEEEFEEDDDDDDDDFEGDAAGFMDDDDDDDDDVDGVDGDDD